MAAVLLVAAAMIAAQSGSGVPDLDTDQLATGPFSRMHMLLEKTIFGVDVLTVEIRFGGATQQRFREIAAGRAYSAGLAAPLAQAAIEAEQAHVTLRFLRDVSFDRWLEGVRDSLGKARQAGLIQDDNYRRVREGLPQWFGAIAERGFMEDDRIVYRAYPDRMRTLLVTNDGRVVVDQTDRGDAPRRAMLAGYLAPGTDFREPLVRSLFSP